jgi:hypothetical protein
LKIRVFNEEERLKVAAILVKNGYRVEQGKEPRTGTKTVDYFLIIENTRETRKNERNVDKPCAD